MIKSIYSNQTTIYVRWEISTLGNVEYYTYDLPPSRTARHKTSEDSARFRSEYVAIATNENILYVAIR